MITKFMWHGKKYQVIPDNFSRPIIVSVRDTDEPIQGTNLYEKLL